MPSHPNVTQPRPHFDKSLRFIRKCYCHDVKNLKRYCYHEIDLDFKFSRERTLMGKLVKNLKCKCNCWVFNNMLISALIVDQLPVTDLIVGRLYEKTNANWTMSPFKLYRQSVKLLTRYMVQIIQMYNHVLKNKVKIYKKGLALKALPGFVATSRIIDQVSNSINGIEESMLCIYVRFAMTVVGAMKEFEYAEIGEKNIHSEIKAVFSLLCDQDIMPSLSLLSHIGLRRPNYSLFDSMVYNVPTIEMEDMCNNLDTLVHALKSGASVSLNVTRYASDCTWIVRYLSMQAKMVNIQTNKKCKITVFFDVWSVAMLNLLQCIESVQNEDVHFAIVIPRIFMKKYRRRESRWLLFFRNVAVELGLCNDDEFEDKYEVYEGTVTQYETKTEDIWEKIKLCVNRKNVSLVFRSNIVKYSMLPLQLASALGGDLDVLPVNEYGHTTCNRTLLNLTNFVDRKVGRHLAEGMDFVRIGDWFFNLNRLRDIVRKIVLISNAVIDMAIEQEDLLSGGIREGRSIAISVSGLHSVFMMLSLKFSSPRARDLYRVISEHVYYSAVRTSVDICIRGKKPCALFRTSKYAQGLLYCDLFEGVKFTIAEDLWASLRRDVREYGLRNIHLISGSHMAQECDVLGVSPSVWPIVSHKWTRPTVLKGKKLCTNLIKPEFYKVYDVHAPVYNRLFLKAFKNHVPCFSDCHFDVSKLDRHMLTPSERKTLKVYKTGFDYMIDDMFEMYRVALPFVDQTQTPVYYYGLDIEMWDSVEKMYDAGFKVGVYKSITRNVWHKNNRLRASGDLLQECEGLVPRDHNVLLM